MGSDHGTRCGGAAAGFALVELVVVLGLTAALLLLAAPRWLQWQDRTRVSRAAVELAQFYQAARYAAILRATRVRIEFTGDTLAAVYEHAAGDSAFLERPGPARHGVSLSATRAAIRIGPTGLGYGAANTTLIVRRGAAADTLTTSRLGRLKRW
ncbi:MAG: hypothetical protein OER21_05335 [Gemmatimonadota bacterium]|nr:hypothetical protein [Gemmatimonadota bacterium]